MKRIILNKGYTVEVVSWENDGDLYETNTVNVNDIETAREIRDMCLLNKYGFLSDQNPWREKEAEITSFMEAHPLIRAHYVNINETYAGLSSFDIWESVGLDLVGCAEDYDIARVVEDVTILYSDKDIEVETVE